MEKKKNGSQRSNSMRMRSSACSVVGKMAAISGPGTRLSVRVQSGCRNSPDQDSFHSFERDVCGALFASE